MSELPKWLQDVNEWVEHRLTHDEPLERDGEMWVEHGSDMLAKIRQLYAELAAVKEQLSETRAALLDCMSYVDCDNLTMQTKYMFWREAYDGKRFNPANCVLEGYSTRQAAEEAGK